MKARLFITCLFTFIAFHGFALRIETGDNIHITEAVREDIYVFGGTVTVDAPVYGDIWCAGGTVTVKDTVTGDLVAAGGNLYVYGNILDDVRAAGGTLIITGHIVGDLLITGGTVTLEPAAVIGGDLAVSGGTAMIGSNVRGNLKAAGGQVTLNGSVEKGLVFNGGELSLNGTVGGAATVVATRINVGEKAALRGNIQYWTDQGEVNFGSALQNGATASFDPSLHNRYERPSYAFLGFASLLAVLWYLTASFILIWLGQWLFPKTFRQAASIVQAEPVRALGYGFLYFAVVPVGIVLLFVTIVGIPVGLIALFFYGLLFVLSSIITVLVGAHWINLKKNYGWQSTRLILVAFGLFVALKILGLIPIIGWIVKLATIFIAFGAILDYSGMLRRRRPGVEQVGSGGMEPGHPGTA